MANGTKEFSVEDPREEIHVDELSKVTMNRRTEKVIYLYDDDDESGRRKEAKQEIYVYEFCQRFTRVNVLRNIV